LKRHVGDVLIVLLLVGSELEIWLSDTSGPRILLTVVAPVLTLPLLLRRRYPAAAPAFVLGASAILSMFAGELAQYALGALNPLFAVWWLADLPERRAARAGLVLGVPVALVLTLNNPKRHVGDFAAAPIAIGVVWLAGSFFSGRVRRARELRERLERADRERELAVAEERARIARELHDVVAHSVSVIVVQAGGVRGLLRDDQERERDALRSIEQTGRSALTEMRRMLGVLRTEEEATPALAPQPGLASLDRLLEQVRAAGLDVALQVEGEQRSVPPGVDLSAYRIVQEALTNSLKHAGPQARAEVTVRFGDRLLELEIVDDGVGPSDGDGLGHGLVGMRERVGLYGGTLEAGSGDGGGFSLRAALPWEKEVE